MFQQRQIEKNRRDTLNTKDLARDTARRTLSAVDRVSALSLLTQALWELLQERHGLSDADLLNKIEEIDLRDSRKDGKVSAVAVSCLSCGHKINKRHRTCIYCGTENAAYSPFTEIGS